ncbi:MAG: hypothetical protein SOI26_04470 [Coriobacteriales bacterium]|jgi:nitrate/nitrite transporter NarK
MVNELISLLLVLVVAIAVAGSVCGLYSLGILLWYGPSAKGAASPAGVAGNSGAATVEGQAPVAAGDRGGKRAAAVVCFGACAVIVLFALWLIIPIFH